MNKCDCIDNDFKFFNLRNITIPRFCDYSTAKDVECYNAYHYQIFEICIEKCPFECDSFTLSISTSISKYPTRTALNNLIENSDLNKIQQMEGDLASKVLKVNIYYEKISYEMLSESPSMTLITLLGGLGGTLGKQLNLLI